eukprot:177161_1
MKKKKMMSALMFASQRKKILLMKILLYHGAHKTLKTQDTNGETAFNLWRGLNKVAEAVADKIEKNSDEYNRILNKFRDFQTKELPNMNEPKNKKQFEKSLLSAQLSRKNLTMKDYEAYHVFKSEYLSDIDKEECRSWLEKSEQDTNNDSSREIIHRYVRQLIQNDSSHTMNAIINRINLQTDSEKRKFNPYFINIQGNGDRNNSFIRLCARYNSLNIMRDMVNLDKKKLSKICVLEQKLKTPFLEATSLEMCKILLSLGFKFETNYYNAKIGLIYNHSVKKNYKIVEWLILNGCNLAKTKGVKERNTFYDNLLMDAILKGVFECLPVLLLLCQRDKRALHLAVETGNITTLRILLNNDFDSDAINDEGMTPMHIGVSVSNRDPVSNMLHPKVKMLYHLLFTLNWSLDVFDNNGNTPLHIAIVGDSYRLKLILKKLHEYNDRGVMIINKKNKNGLTALQLLTITSDDKISNAERVTNMKILLSTNKCNLDGMLIYVLNQYLAISMAKDSGDNDLFNVLVKYGATFDTDIEGEIIAKMKKGFTEDSKLLVQILANYSSFLSFQKHIMKSIKGTYDRYNEGGKEITDKETNFIIEQVIENVILICEAELKYEQIVKEMNKNIICVISRGLQKSTPAPAHVSAHVPVPMGSAPLPAPMPTMASPELSDELSRQRDRMAKKFFALCALSQSSVLYMQSQSEKKIQRVEYDTYENFNIWNVDENYNGNEEQRKYCENESKTLVMEEFESNNQFIKDYGEIKNVSDLEKMLKKGDILRSDENNEVDRNKEMLDFLLTIMDNNDTSKFAQSYFDDIIMYYLFDKQFDLLNTICSASQYEPILLKIYKRSEFRQNIKSIICKHENEKTAQLVVESLIFAYGKRYMDLKDKTRKKGINKDEIKIENEKSEMSEINKYEIKIDDTKNEIIEINDNEIKTDNIENGNSVLFECIEFIMKETIYTKLKIKSKLKKEKVEFEQLSVQIQNGSKQTDDKNMEQISLEDIVIKEEKIETSENTVASDYLSGKK